MQTQPAFIDIRLRPGITTLFFIVAARVSQHLSALHPLRPNVTSFVKLEVHNAVRGGPSHGHRGSVQHISWRLVQWFQRYAHRQTDRQTDRQVDQNTRYPYWGGVIIHIRLNIMNYSQGMDCIYSQDPHEA